MILIQNALRFMCYFITFSSFYYPRKDIHAFRIELKHNCQKQMRGNKHKDKNIAQKWEKSISDTPIIDIVVFWFVVLLGLSPIEFFALCSVGMSLIRFVGHIRFVEVGMVALVVLSVCRISGLSLIGCLLPFMGSLTYWVLSQYHIGGYPNNLLFGFGRNNYRYR